MHPVRLALVFTAGATAAELSPALAGRASCGDDPAWAATGTAYVNSNANDLARAWWDSQEQTDLANQLATSFGDHRTGFSCGINKVASCVVGGCSGEYNGV